MGRYKKGEDPKFLAVSPTVLKNRVPRRTSATEIAAQRAVHSR